MYAIAFHAIDPVALEIGPLTIRWYALAYVVGIMLGWRYMVLLARRPPALVSPTHIDDFVVWATLGVVLGGRLGYVLFYKPAYFLDHPGEILAMWQGGMSFHGGLCGMVAASVIYAYARKISCLALGDLICAAVPIGLFLGRVANFINGELYGRTTTAAWGMVFPGGGPLPRHPSQLYEAILEGLVLFIILAVLSYRGRALAHPGLISGVFLVGYALTRGIAELFRQPDAHLGFLTMGTTMGQLLSLPLMLAGLYLILRVRRR